MDFVDFFSFDSLSGFLDFLFLRVGTGFFEKWTWLVELSACQACSGFLRLSKACSKAWQVKCHLTDDGGNLSW